MDSWNVFGSDTEMLSCLDKGQTSHHSPFQLVLLIRMSMLSDLGRTLHPLHLAPQSSSYHNDYRGEFFHCDVGLAEAAIARYLEPLPV